MSNTVPAISGVLLFTLTMAPGCGDDSPAATTGGTSVGMTANATLMTGDATTAGTTSDPYTTVSDTDDPYATGTQTTPSSTSDPYTSSEYTSVGPTSTSDSDGTTGVVPDCDIDGLPDVSEIDFAGYSPVFTADSASIVIAREDAIVQLTLCGDVAKVVAAHDGIGTDTSLMLNPDSSTLYYSYNDFFGDDAGVRRVSFPDGGAAEKLLDQVGVYQITVTPSEDELYYYVNNTGSYRLPLTPPGPAEDLAIDPPPRHFSPSPDGGAVAFMNGLRELYTLDVESDQTQLVYKANGTPPWVIQWLPDGERIAFAEEDPSMEVYIRTYNLTDDQIADVLLVEELVFQDFAISPDLSWAVLNHGQFLKLVAL